MVSLIVALQMTAITALIAAPNIGAYFAQYQLMSATNQLGFEIARARMQAVGQNQYVHVKMLSSTQYVRETSTDATTWSNRVTTTLPRGLTVTQTSAEIRFDRRGYATVNNSITLNNTNQRAKTVATSLVGRVTIT